MCKYKKSFLLYPITFIILLCLSFVSFSQTKTQLPCVNKKFSIVAHIVLDSLKRPGTSQADILRDIDSLNEAMKDVCISFQICELNIIENSVFNYFHEDSVWSELRFNYNKKNRINMYFVSSIIAPAGERGLSTQSGIGILDTSAILIRKDPHMFGTIAHQIGHYFGLHNTFGEIPTELVNGSNCSTTGDSLCDTPADPFILGSGISNYINNCKFVNTEKDANGDYYIPHVGNIMGNYGVCGCEFSRQQLKLMADTYISSKGMW